MMSEHAPSTSLSLQPVITVPRGEPRAIGICVSYGGLNLGDEAILPAGPMDLSGRSAKSLRKAVNRVARNGFQAELHAVGELGPGLTVELQRLSERWRYGEPERGFSMAHDALYDELLADASVVLARDGDGRVRGFLHFVPVFGRRAVSLAFMRRDRDTPNGLTEFMVVRAIEQLRARGVREASLNFAVFARLIHDPRSRLERLTGRVLLLADRCFQIERLYRFNAKFFPRWEPRYVVFERRLSFPRVGLAALWAEGQLPKPWRR